MLDAMDCTQALQAPLMQQIIRVESGSNPYAIGVVGNQLVRQPRSLAEALVTAKSLESQGLNYSVGLGQVNRIHFSRLGWELNLAKGFDACANVLAAAEIFNECHKKALRGGYIPAPYSSQPIRSPSNKSDNYSATHAALSCYYSGDLLRGARLGYVARVLGDFSGSDGVPVKGAPSPRAFSMMID